MKQLFFGSSLQGNKAFTISWVLFRVYVGLSIAIGAGYPKMKDIAAPGWFVDQVNELGFTFPSPAFWAAMASWGEFVGGLFIAIGFFTRFSALQLAFQFFVIAFIWYGEPMPMVGMYYQQLLFWCFVLITVAGSGKYGVDQWIINRKKPMITSSVRTGLALLFLTISIPGVAQNKPLNGSGIILTQTYEFSDFTQLELLDLAGEIEVEIGKPFSITVAIDDNLKPLLKVEKNAALVKISLQGNENNKRYLEATNIRIRITMPAITSLKHSSNSRVQIKGMQGPFLLIRNSGNGNVMIDGTVGDLDIACFGNGDVKADQLIAIKVSVEKTGNGDVLINTENSFTATGFGNGNVINNGIGKASIGSSIKGNGIIRSRTEKKNSQL